MSLSVKFISPLLYSTSLSDSSPGTAIRSKKNGSISSGTIERDAEKSRDSLVLSQEYLQYAAGKEISVHNGTYSSAAAGQKPVQSDGMVNLSNLAAPTAMDNKLWQKVKKRSSGLPPMLSSMGGMLPPNALGLREEASNGDQPGRLI